MGTISTLWKVGMQDDVSAKLASIKQGLTLTQSEALKGSSAIRQAFSKAGAAGSIDGMRASLIGLEKELAKTKDETKRLALEAKAADLRDKLNAAGAVVSMKDLKMELRELIKLQQSSSSAVAMKEYGAQIDAVKLKMKSLNQLAGGGMLAPGGAAASGGMRGKLGQMFSMVGGPMMAAGGAFALTMAVQSIGEMGMDYENSMGEFSAITEITGKDLETFGERAEAMAIKFGGSAITQIDNMKNVLGALGGELAQTPDLLQHITDNINTMSKAGKIDLATASNAMTGYINSLGISLKDTKAVKAASDEVMESFAAASRAGAGEMDYLLTAYSNAAVKTNSYKISLQETAAVFEILAGNQVQAEVAGTGFATMLDGFAKITGSSDLQKYLQGFGVNVDVLLNKSLPLATRLQELSKIATRDDAIIKVFGGGMDSSIVTKLTNNLPQLAAMTEEVKKTGVAHEMAAINMNTTAEKLARLNAAWGNFKLMLWSGLGQLSPLIEFATQNFAALMITAAAVGLYMAGPYLANMATAGWNVLKFAWNIGVATVSILQQGAAALWAAWANGSFDLGLRRAAISVVNAIRASAAYTVTLFRQAYAATASFLASDGLSRGLSSLVTMTWNGMKAAWGYVTALFTQTTATGATTVATTGLGAALKALALSNPFTIILMGIAALAVGIYYYWDEIKLVVANIKAEIAELGAWWADSFVGSKTVSDEMAASMKQQAKNFRHDANVAKIEYTLSKAEKEQRDKQMQVGNWGTQAYGPGSWSQQIGMLSAGSATVSPGQHNVTGPPTGADDGSRGGAIKNFNIKIERLVENIIINATNGVGDMGTAVREEVRKALIGAVYDTEVLAATS